MHTDALGRNGDFADNGAVAGLHGLGIVVIRPASAALLHDDPRRLQALLVLLQPRLRDGCGELGPDHPYALAG